jgi:phage FluMu protein Com
MSQVVRIDLMASEHCRHCGPIENPEHGYTAGQDHIDVICPRCSREIRKITMAGMDREVDGFLSDFFGKPVVDHKIRSLVK